MGTPRPGTPLLERRAVVTVVLCCQLRRGTYRCSEAIHRTAKDAALTGKRCLIPRPKARGFTAPRINLVRGGAQGSFNAVDNC
jgi:ribosomal protein L15E